MENQIDFSQKNLQKKTPQKTKNRFLRNKLVLKTEF